MSERPETMPENDVIELLLHQHREIRRLFIQAEKNTGDERAAAFDHLRRLLAVHETAEEEIVHPTARRSLSDGDKVVDARLEEENHAKQMLEQLEEIGPQGRGFVKLLGELKTAVLTHAEHEEREEFSKLKEKHSHAERVAMGVAVKAAAAMAPTHPHAGVESATANILVGPYAAMLDRSRDVVRQAVQRVGGDS
jgi:hemerythrin superfamily protein